MAAPAPPFQGDIAVEFTLDGRDVNVQVVEDPPGSRSGIKRENRQKVFSSNDMSSVAIRGIGPGTVRRGVESNTWPQATLVEPMSVAGNGGPKRRWLELRIASTVRPSFLQDGGGKTARNRGGARPGAAGVGGQFICG